jgi:hypothetical protein
LGRGGFEETNFKYIDPFLLRLEKKAENEGQNIWLLSTPFVSLLCSKYLRQLI